MTGTASADEVTPAGAAQEVTTTAESTTSTPVTDAGSTVGSTVEKVESTLSTSPPPPAPSPPAIEPTAPKLTHSVGQVKVETTTSTKRVTSSAQDTAAPLKNASAETTRSAEATVESTTRVVESTASTPKSHVESAVTTTATTATGSLAGATAGVQHEGAQTISRFAGAVTVSVDTVPTARSTLTGLARPGIAFATGAVATDRSSLSAGVVRDVAPVVTSEATGFAGVAGLGRAHLVASSTSPVLGYGLRPPVALRPGSTRLPRLLDVGALGLTSTGVPTSAMRPSSTPSLMHGSDPMLPAAPHPRSPLLGVFSTALAATLSSSAHSIGLACFLGFLMLFGLSGSTLMRAAGARATRPEGAEPPVSPA